MRKAAPKPPYFVRRIVSRKVAEIRFRFIFNKIKNTAYRKRDKTLSICCYYHLLFYGAFNLLADEQHAEGVSATVACDYTARKRFADFLEIKVVFYQLFR